MKKNIIILAIIIAGAVVLRFFFSAVTGFLKGNRAGQPVPEVKVETIKEQKVKKYYEAPGRVVSVYRVSVLARVSGYLEQSYFTEGSCVKKGDTLFLIEPDEYRENANIASADVNKIQAQLEYANKQLIRAQELVKQDYIAKAKYDEILSNRNSLSAQLEAAKNNLKDKRRNLGYTSVKAPVEGRIGTIDVTVGNYVTPSSGALTTINSIDPMYVTFPLSSEDYDEITEIDGGNRINRKVELYFSDGDKYPYDGYQDFWDNEVEQTTGTITFRATFKNPDNRLLHGEFVKVKIFAQNEVNVPVVPVAAVQSNQEGKYVFKLDDKGLPQITYITDSGIVGENYIVKTGLKAGDRVITDGLAKVYPNKKVKIMGSK